MANRFNFTGTFSVDEEKFITVGKTKAGKDYCSLRCSVLQSRSNRAFLEAFGQKEKEVTVKNESGESISTSWENRKDEEFVKQARQKFVLALSQTDRLEFVSKVDLILAVKEHIDELKDKKVTITGTIQKNLYQGKWSDRFVINNIYVVPEETPSKLMTTTEFFFNKESIDGIDFKEDKKVYLNGYVSEYIDKETGNKYVPHQLVINAGKLNFEDDYHSKRFAGLLMVFKAKRDDMKISSVAKNTDYYKMMVNCSYNNGAEQVEWDESMLTEFQKEMVDLGINNIDDFKPRGQVFGERVTIYNVVSFDARDDYANGSVEVCKAKEFEEDIYATPDTTEETVADIEKSMNPPVEDDSFDLFG